MNDLSFTQKKHSHENRPFYSENVSDSSFKELF